MNKKLKVTLITILLLILAVGGGLYFYFSHLIGKIDKVETKPEDIGITQDTEDKLSKYDTYNDIINIALFGVDAADQEAGRSDSIMILSIDPVHNKLKISSIMRDSYVDIPGYGMDKINHAFAFGNSVLALKTINQNFDLNVDKFISTNFTNLPKIIDKIGGIELNIKAEEVELVNKYTNNLNKINGTNSGSISGPGKHRVDGTQALAYSRIRYTDGGDYERTSRHRTVLTAIFSQVKDIPVTQFPSLLGEFLPMVQTNMNNSDLLKIGSTISKINTNELIQDRFPRDGFCQGETINRTYYLTFDKDSTVEQMHKFIYEE